jgi:hypothetical protein
MPLWFDKSVRKLFLESDCEFDKRDFSELINEHLNDSEKKLYNAISKRVSTNTEKMKTDGKPNFEMATTKAAMTKPQMEYKKKEKEFDQRQALSKKRKERWGENRQQQQ